MAKPAAKTGKSGGGDPTRLAYLERLRKITHQIHSADNLDDILLHLQNPILSLFEAERITIYAVDKVKREIFSKFLVGDLPSEIRVPITKKSVAGYVAATGTQISIADAYNNVELLAIYPDLKFDQSWDKQSGYRTKQILAHPLMYEKYLMGVVQIINKKSEIPFTAQDRNVIQEIAEVLALAFYNHQKRAFRYKTKFEYLTHNNMISKGRPSKGDDRGPDKKMADSRSVDEGIQGSPRRMSVNHWPPIIIWVSTHMTHPTRRHWI